MSTTQEIVRAIIARVEQSKPADYTFWKTGITQDPKERKEFWGDPPRWIHFEADSLGDAHGIESYFVYKEKMQSGTSGTFSKHATT